MATAMDLLLSNDETDDTFVISEDLRTVTVPKGQEVLGVYSDECVRTIHFSMPRFCDDTDLNRYNISICYRNNDGIENRAAATNVQSNADTITFDWTVGRDACSAVGKTSFSVCARAFSNSVVTNEFNTAICTMRVLEGVETDYAEQDQVADAVGPLVQATANALADIKEHASAEAIDKKVKEATNALEKQFASLGLSVVDGRICQTYRKDA